MCSQVRGKDILRAGTKMKGVVIGIRLKPIRVRAKAANMVQSRFLRIINPMVRTAARGVRKSRPKKTGVLPMKYDMIVPNTTLRDPAHGPNRRAYVRAKAFDNGNVPAEPMS